MINRFLNRGHFLTKPFGLYTRVDYSHSRFFSKKNQNYLVEVNQASKEYHDKILNNISLKIFHHDRYILLGQNGVGKSTLAKILWNDEQLDTGNIHYQPYTKIGYLPQNIMPYLQEPYSLSNFLKSSPFLRTMNNDGEVLVNSQKNVESIFLSLLQESGLKKTKLDDDFYHFSAGERTKVILASLIAHRPDLLILDEPTNNLDLAGIDWLRKWLFLYKGAIFMITHDRSLIASNNKMASTTKIIELDPDQHIPISLHGSYADYLEKKLNDHNQLIAKQSNLKDEIKLMKNQLNKQQEQSLVRHVRKQDNNKLAFNFRGGRAEKHHSKKMSELNNRLETTQNQIHNCSTHRYIPQFLFNPIKTFSSMLSIQDLSYQYENHEVFKDLQCNISAGDRIVITGQNGIGKTTLFKIISGIKKQTQGIVKLESNIKIGYLDQEQESLNLTLTSEQYLDKCDATNVEIYNTLFQLGFSIIDIKHPLAELSLGQRRLVQIAELIINKANLLLLDEPTNHLSPQAAESLENALIQFSGGILAISHDRYFINKIATHEWCFGDPSAPSPAIHSMRFK